MRNIPVLVAVSFALSISAATVAHDDHPDDPAAKISEDRLKSDIEKLVGFGTRHTMSDQESPVRGIGAARRWGEGEFRKASDACGGCLEIALPERMVEGRRIPTPTRLVNVVAIQRGTERPDEVVIVQGHIDSRGTDVSDFTIDAPGANDDASGTALVIEAARVLSQHKYPTTIVYALLSGEEQGLYGGRLMADYAEAQGWTVKAVLNNDIVGGSCGSDGYCDPEHIRVFSEGPRADLTDAVRAAQRRDGGENDSPSRNLSRWLDELADQYSDGLNVRQIWRTDRMGRGGDQIPFLEKGFPAIRFTVAVEDYEHQHQDLRVEDGVTYGDTADEMDFAYLAKATQLNVRALDKLAKVPMPPAPTAQAAVRTDTLLEWQGVPGASGYAIVGRRPDEPYWTQDFGLVSYETPSTTKEVTPVSERSHRFIVKERGDDWIFGVQAIGFYGSGPSASAVPAGAFEPIPQESETD
ncbi:M20/M25/M40 family metallo-hydrolase [Pontixanthobacter gangjinensis]|uniref:M20/M25/M40 family metallo-hydrolase n=1 Tax=Pontixanthobacter gangjinensis TaxID=1028742 RepID=A0A6I4SMT2_9SPHN|nr:M20/M25/M40 family metallo-hydrolase [Pontixanthobacter gangjinensis]MXO56994.1 M20/M25/M40 family metallo-hydrolase [Pontixanthobacter gangjinensis]